MVVGMETTVPLNADKVGIVAMRIYFVIHLESFGGLNGLKVFLAHLVLCMDKWLIGNY